MSVPEYQKDLSLQSPILLDYRYKRSKVEKMLAILREAGAIGEVKRGLAVDVGCSGGFFVSALVPWFDVVVGIDIDMHALRMATANTEGTDARFLCGDSMRLPFVDDSVDLVICNHVYEHVPDPSRMFAEIYRVLRPGGCCYLGAASRWCLIEPHYKLPFLSWLPKPLAHRYMRLFGKGDFYYENLRSCGGIRRLVEDFSIEDYTVRIITHPDRYHATDLIPEHSPIRHVPEWCWRMIYRLLPTYLLILRK